MITMLCTSPAKELMRLVQKPNNEKAAAQKKPKLVPSHAKNHVFRGIDRIRVEKIHRNICIIATVSTFLRKDQVTQTIVC